MSNTFAVIMAGGVGSRFWPASRAQNPKQLLDLNGSGQSMIAATVDRLSPTIAPEQVLVVTSGRIRDAVIAALPQVPKENILAEPVGRNTAPCIGWAALHVMHRDPEAVMAVMPSDHLVADTAGFHTALSLAIAAAREGELVTFGIRPSSPETGFGYIETGSAHSPGVRKVSRFVEKPSLELAREYLARGNFAWNSGMFFFKAARILQEIERRMPSLFLGLEELRVAISADREEQVLGSVFPRLPAESIDYGIMEKAEDILCVPVDFGWSDLGSWDAAWELSPKNGEGNALGSNDVAVNSHNCLVRAPEGKVIALVGVDDLVVVDTGDALLICRRDSTQDVKKIVTRLEALGRKDLL